jgi:hypothetical protein
MRAALNLWFTDACGPTPNKIGHSNPVFDPCASPRFAVRRAHELPSEHIAQKPLQMCCGDNDAASLFDVFEGRAHLLTTPRGSWPMTWPTRPRMQSS